mmetsp:Transcript_5848/g.13859  ORF Transcript_5848/g.13859 Transcript_5848/m.13859 type:complete len:276 (-) Transcript_5848:218-1045(-)
MSWDRFWTAVEATRTKGPLVQCLTNYVSMDIVANGLLAIGASPAMVHAIDELSDAVPIVGATGGAVSINIGTLDERWIQSFEATVALCRTHKVPWVLDPVAAGFTTLRTSTAVRLMELHPPDVVRGNASEILALAGAAGGGKGVDSTDASDAAVVAATLVAEKFGCVVCVSGATDYVVAPGGAVSCCRHGHEMLTKVTAAGCLVSSVIAAFLAARPEGFSVSEATLWAMCYFGRCAEEAALGCEGPGTFRVKFLDKLYSVGARPDDASLRAEFKS